MTTEFALRPASELATIAAPAPLWLNTGNTIMKDEIERLTERLKEKIDSGRRTVGGGVIGTGKCETLVTWGGEKIMILRNPDGSAAVNIIADLTRQLDYEESLSSHRPRLPKF